MPSLTLRHEGPDKNAGTVAVVIFIAGAIILVLVIILILLFFKKRRSARNKTFIPRLERSRGGNYGKLEEDEEHAWSADMGEHDGAVSAAGGKGSYAPVHNESMGYHSQTLQHGDAAKDTYR